MTQSKAILDAFETSAAKPTPSPHDKTAAVARQITDEARDERDAQSARLKARRLARDAGDETSDDFNETT
jgi:hypothetical protein